MTTPSPMPASDPLARVKRTAAAQERATRAHRVALRDAYAAGISYGELGRALGVSRQAVRQLVERAR